MWRASVDCGRMPAGKNGVILRFAQDNRVGRRAAPYNPVEVGDEDH
jgi:hypothetical protein